MRPIGKTIKPLTLIDKTQSDEAACVALEEVVCLGCSCCDFIYVELGSLREREAVAD